MALQEEKERDYGSSTALISQQVNQANSVLHWGSWTAWLCERGQGGDEDYCGCSVVAALGKLYELFVMNCV